jgi:uncharacterized protein YkwD
MKNIGFFLVITFSLYAFDFSKSDPISHSFKHNPSGNERVRVINPSYENELIRLINQYRIENGLEALEVNNSLMQASRYHAADMANENYFEHATHNRNRHSLQRGISTFKRIGRFYDGFANTENIGAGYFSPQSVFEGWVNSPGHDVNLLNPSSTHVGVGFYETNNSSYKRYWVFASSVE